VGTEPLRLVVAEAEEEAEEEEVFSTMCIHTLHSEEEENEEELTVGM
jgi:hypothetical protein